MMRIEPFGVELWMNEFETTCDYNLAETCVDSLTLEALLALANMTGDELMADLLPMRLSYGEIIGSERLRTAIAGLYQSRRAEHVIVTHGAIGANSLVHHGLVEADDRVISFVPNYQQHYSIPESIGADVHRLELRADNNYLVDLDELAAAATPGTKLIAMSNPNNPTGSLMDEDFLQQVVAIADRCGAYILSDEVYRGIDQDGSGTTTSIADLYERGISTGSMSKAFSLAGLRLGWVVGPDDVLELVSTHRDYNTISVGMVDDRLAAVALEHAEPILARSRDITRRNLAILSEWIDAEPLLSWVRPSSGTTGIVHYNLPLPARDFCVQLLDETGVMFTPGSVMGIDGSIRVGFANDTDILTAGLAKVSTFLASRSPAA